MSGLTREIARIQSSSPRCSFVSPLAQNRSPTNTVESMPIDVPIPTITKALLAEERFAGSSASEAIASVSRLNQAFFGRVKQRGTYR